MNFEDWLSEAFRRGEGAIPLKTLDVAEVALRGRRNRRIHLAAAAAGIAAAIVVVAGVGQIVGTELTDDGPRPPATGLGTCTESEPSSPPGGESSPGAGNVVTEPTLETAQEAREFASRPDNRADRAVLTWIDFVVEGDEEAAWRMLSKSVQNEIGRDAWHSIIEKGGLASVYAPFQEPPHTSVHIPQEINSPREGSLYVVTLATVENDAAVAIPTFVPMEGDVRIQAPSGDLQFLAPANPGEVVPCDVVFEVSVQGSMPTSVEFFIEVSSVSGEVTDFAEPASGVYTARFAPKEGLEPGGHIATVVKTGRDGVTADAITFTVEDSKPE